MVKTSVKDVDQAAMVRATSAFLKKSDKIKEPEWADLVKLGRHKELAPYDPDWFYTRVAAIARHLYVRSPTGVGALTKVFGGKQRRGVAPSHHVRSHRNCIRKALQELEKIKWVEKVPDSNGRRLTGIGRKDLDRIAVSIRNAEKE